MSSPLRHLRAADPALAAIIDRVGPYRLEPRTEGTHFDYVVRCIVGQQLQRSISAYETCTAAVFQRRSS
jgi:DNA-3-methyladenine glycosylase II